MSPRLTVDVEVCTMAGECIYNHPDHFEWNDDDRPVVLRPDMSSADDRRHGEQAISVCPSGAISIIDT